MMRLGIIFLIAMIAISCDSKKILLQSTKEPVPPTTIRSVSEAYSIASSAIALLNDTYQQKPLVKILSYMFLTFPTKEDSQ